MKKYVVACMAICLALSALAAPTYLHSDEAVM